MSNPSLGTITDPNLPPASTDLILMVDVYHEFDHPHAMVESMVKALKPGGRIVFVEFRGEDPKVPIKPVHKMTEAQVRKEMAPFPLEWAETLEVLPDSTHHCLSPEDKPELADPFHRPSCRLSHLNPPIVDAPRSG